MILGAVDVPFPSEPVALTVATGRRLWTLSIDPNPDPAVMRGRPDCVVLLVQREALHRLGGKDLIVGDTTGFLLAPDLRAIALALCEPSVSAEVRAAYQLAKSIEFICETIRLFNAGQLAPLISDRHLSAADTLRMMAARELIETRANEKLTLDFIARNCGLNRSKLTRGFKEMFECTIAHAIAERRLELARRMLLTTDLPVSSIGYESGYRNNASFSRAFGRRFGSSPSDFRVRELAA